MSHFARLSPRSGMARRTRATHRRRQAGAVLFIALIVLVVMLLVGVGMIRKTGTGSSIAGNLAFKQGATAVADLGVETARKWIHDNPALLNADSTSNGYFSTWAAGVDATAYWSGATATATANCPSIPNVVNVTCDDGMGNAVYYVIHRLCESAGAPDAATQRCVAEADAEVGGTKGGIDYGSAPGNAPVGLPYYRITTRVVGPRNTLSYTQMLMY